MWVQVLKSFDWRIKNCIHAEIKTNLDEQNIVNLEQATTAADDYALTSIIYKTKKFK